MGGSEEGLPSNLTRTVTISLQLIQSELSARPKLERSPQDCFHAACSRQPQQMLAVKGRRRHSS